MLFLSASPESLSLCCRLQCASHYDALCAQHLRGSIGCLICPNRVVLLCVEIMVTAIKPHKFHCSPASMHEILMRKLQFESDTSVCKRQGHAYDYNYPSPAESNPHMIASLSLLPLQSFLYNQHYLTLSIVTSLVNIVITTGWPASATASSPFGSTLYGDADECWQLYYVSPHRCLMTLFAYQASIRPHCRILNNNREEMQAHLF